MAILQESELILNADGSIYHLGIHPEHLADTIILVGDPQRVEKVSQYFDAIEFQQQRREFVTCTGRIGKQRFTCLATGIGTDNIDIVLNELDALVNVDLATRQIKEQHTALTFVRLGTSGSIREDLPVDSLLVANYGIGLEGLLLFYEQNRNASTEQLQQQFTTYLAEHNFQFPIAPTFASADQDLVARFQGADWRQGISITATGFYAPQNRTIRAKSVVADLFDWMQDFVFENKLRITNLEMETSAIYGMANILGHRALALNAILANRPTGRFTSDPKGMEQRLIRQFFDVYLD
ncbi:MAG: nucleoside phosphorylase [Aureispira sp.]